MKKIFLTAVAILTALGLQAQKSEATFFTQEETFGNDPTPVAVDTLDTNDKYTKIILFNNHTWAYLELERPNISDNDFDSDDWEVEGIHAYKDVTIASLPPEVDLVLTDSSHRWACPKVGYVTSGWKFRRYREHKGTDIRLNIGDTVRSAFDGKVRVVRSVGQAGGYGNLVVVRHVNGLETYYGHLSKHLVKEGDLVAAGEPIALGGNTGRSTGPHLHFEARYMGKPFDPERLFDFANGELRDSLFTLKKHYFNIYSHFGQTDRESSATAETVVHVIKSGDTLGALARRYHTTVSKICALNGIRSTQTLRLGQRVKVR